LFSLPANFLITNHLNYYLSDSAAIEGFGLIKEIAQSKTLLLENDKWNLQIDILDIKDGLAAVEVVLPTSINYLQLAKIDGQWKIINSLKNL